VSESDAVAPTSPESDACVDAAEGADNDSNDDGTAENRRRLAARGNEEAVVVDEQSSQRGLRWSDVAKTSTSSYPGSLLSSLSVQLSLRLAVVEHALVPNDAIPDTSVILSNVQCTRALLHEMVFPSRW